MEIIIGFTIIVAILVIGDTISTATKAVIPSVFVQALLFMVGFWTVLPKDIVTTSGFAGLSLLAMYLLITHMGTMLDLKQLIEQWRTVVIACAGLVGIVLGCMTIGRMVLGSDIAFIATPPLTGGTVATLLMGEAAKEKGLEDLIVLPILVYVGQGFVGYPLTSFMLKKEDRRLLNLYRSGQMKRVEQAEGGEVEGKFRVIPPVPEKYESNTFMLLRLGFVAMLAYFTATALNKGLAAMGASFTIHKLVVCLIFGVIASEIGFVEKKTLNKANSFGFLMTALLGYIFADLNRSTPEMVVQLIGPLIGILFFGIAGMYVIVFFVGKLLHESPAMAWSIAMNALYGFPQNFMLTHESAKSVTEDADEREFLIEQTLPKMLVGGFVTVTIASVIIAGIFIGML
ncbi:hypothetical protein [Clostridium sp. AM58-1XD]|uniref:hypothetical protein n=1 Tax=Clostridium sp. AM58-1XD TaxID=2292307 RepID=UPI000E4F8F91|nr:hypothetical protein [Clostridium sp. AM58-1XD]RGY97365.1 hypothetical protein DXA13_14675 [Clostridium sp. AM58-1XD]